MESNNSAMKGINLLNGVEHIELLPDIKIENLDGEISDTGDVEHIELLPHIKVENLDSDISDTEDPIKEEVDTNFIVDGQTSDLDAGQSNVNISSAHERNFITNAPTERSSQSTNGTNGPPALVLNGVMVNGMMVNGLVVSNLQPLNNRLAVIEADSLSTRGRASTSVADGTNQKGVGSFPTSANHTLLLQQQRAGMPPTVQIGPPPLNQIRTKRPIQTTIPQKSTKTPSSKQDETNSLLQFVMQPFYIMPPMMDLYHPKLVQSMNQQQQAESQNAVQYSAETVQATIVQVDNGEEHSGENFLKCNFKTSDKNDLDKHKISDCKKIPYSCSKQQPVPVAEPQKVHYSAETIQMDHREQCCENAVKSALNLKLLKCNLCNFRTSIKNHLHKHKILHCCKKVPYSCFKCDYTTDSISLYRRHILAEHTNGLRYKLISEKFANNLQEKILENTSVISEEVNKLEHLCSLCGYKTQSSELLKVHRVALHSVKEYLYSCGICAFKSTAYSQVLSHERSHEGLKSYPCRFCNAIFNSMFLMKAHNVAKHPRHYENKLIEYSCKYCNLKINTSYELKLHMKSHEPEQVLCNG